MVHGVLIRPSLPLALVMSLLLIVISTESIVNGVELKVPVYEPNVGVVVLPVDNVRISSFVTKLFTVILPSLSAFASVGAVAGVTVTLTGRSVFWFDMSKVATDSAVLTRRANAMLASCDEKLNCCIVREMRAESTAVMQFEFVQSLSSYSVYSAVKSSESC